VGVFLLATGFVVVLLAGLMHEVEFIHEAAFLEQLEGPVDGDSIQLRVFFFRELKEALRIQMLTRLVDEIKKDFALAREPYATLGKRIPG
jgi:hypothetical protein